MTNTVCERVDCILLPDDDCRLTFLLNVGPFSESKISLLGLELIVAPDFLHKTPKVGFYAISITYNITTRTRRLYGADDANLLLTRCVAAQITCGSGPLL